MKKDLCYMIYPATDGQDWELIFRSLVKPAAQTAGFEQCKLSLPMGKPGSPIEDIISPLVEADLVVIDVTGCDDPPTFYLLGVRHARSNRTILITQDPLHILTDFRPYHSITYDTQGLKAQENFKKGFQAVLARIEAEPEKPDNPVLRYIERDVAWRETIQIQQRKIEELERKLQAQSSPGRPQSDQGRIKFKKIS